MEKPKLYCPFCELELSGTAHKNDLLAWSQFNCEFSTDIDSETPLTELHIKTNVLLRKTSLKKELDQDLRVLKARILELKAKS